MTIMNASKTHVNASMALWASAFVIAALILLQLGRGGDTAAYADQVADRGSYTLMTANSGLGGEADPDEVLYVIDSREQVLLVYEVEDARKRQMFLRRQYNLDNLFMQARQ